MWEIWNEPNGGFWKPQANVKEYGQLALETAKAIKAADPKATVLAPGSAGIPLDFLEGVFQTGILHYIDAVSLHPYRGDNPETASHDYSAVRRLIRQYAPPGKSIPLVSSEWGYNTVDVSEDIQAQYLARQWLSNLTQGVRLSIWYDWHEDGTDPKYTEHHFGTVRFDYTPKPAFLAGQKLTQALGGYRFVKRLPLASDGDYLLLFARGPSAKLAYWTTRDDHAVQLPTAGSAPLTLTRSPQYQDAGGDAALRAAASWSAAAADEFYAQGETPRLILTCHGVDTRPHRVRFQVQVTTPMGEKNMAPTREAAVGAGLTQTVPLPGLSRVTVSARVWVTLDGVRQPYAQEVTFAPTDPLRLSVAPLAKDQLQLQIANPAGTTFSGSLALIPAGRALTTPVRVSAGLKEIEVTLPKTSGKVSRVLLQDTHGNPVAVLPMPRFVPLDIAPSSLKAVFDGDLKVPSTVQLAPLEGPPPGGAALKVDYQFAPGWSFLRLVPPPSTPLPGQPLGIGLWVYGDGSGNLVRMRFQDATGQAFQPSSPDMNWTGWRFVSLRIVPAPGEAADFGHWGGANDGKVHYPVQVDTLFLLDSRADAPKHAGTIWIKSPVLIYN